MKHKITTITIILGCIIIIMLCILIPQYYKVKNDNAYLRNEIISLNLQLKCKELGLATYQEKYTGSMQQVEQLTLDNMAMSIEYDKLNTSYTITKSYANMSEYILYKLGVNFAQVE